MKLVFVYGSLRKGLHNHGLVQEQKFLGLGRLHPINTRMSFTMRAYCASFPAVYRDQVFNEMGTIDGEVYGVDDECLARLDGLEGHPHWYRREEVEVTLQDGHNVKVWMYVMTDRPQGPIVASGDWMEFVRPWKRFQEEKESSEKTIDLT